MAHHYIVAMLAVLCLVCAADGQLQNVGSAAVEAAVRNPRYMRRQISCLLNETPCDSIGRNMRQLVPSLMNGQCPGCTPEQHAQAMRVITLVSQQYPQDYSRIYHMYARNGQGRQAVGK